MSVFFKVDGKEYPLPDFDTIDFEEARAIKSVTGLRMGELMPAFEAGDADAVLALFVVAKIRVDGSADPDELGKLKIADLDLVSSDEVEGEGEESEVPLAPPPEKKKQQRGKPSAPSA